MKTLKILASVAIAGVLLALAFLYSGFYPIGADRPHTGPVFWALQTLRERSIATRTAGIDVPDLDRSELLLAGGPDYNEMCAGCHLKPGKSSSEMSLGLYPQPPDLAQAPANAADAKASAARQFWIIKHGLKASAMPAWGATHDDARIWAMVAFLQKLPTLTPDQYQILTARSEGDMDHDEMEMGENHAASPTSSDEHSEHAGETPAARTAEDAVSAFQTALKSGDAAGAAAWLAPEAVIYEGGEVEHSRAEYQKQHLPADIVFLKNAQVELLKRDAAESGDAAWVISETRMRGKSSKGRDIDVHSTETALLRKTAEGWRIVHIHWSSSPSS
jgi:ketosteroid isomerase-like protein/mono/diheme cytochrome c family protein